MTKIKEGFNNESVNKKSNFVKQKLCETVNVYLICDTVFRNIIHCYGIGSEKTVMTL